MTVCGAPIKTAGTLPTADDIAAAANVVGRYMAPTPLIRWPLLAARTGCEVLVKHENHSPVGAFKVRGGLVYMHHLRETQPCVQGVITATRGNHGQSVALAASTLGLRSVIVVPEGNSPEKNAAMEALGAELVVHGHDFQAAAEHAGALQAAWGLHFVPPYHPMLVRGVATYGVEMFNAAPDLDAVIVPVGMGSGISGVLAARAAVGARARVYGVVTEGAPAYAKSFRTGYAVPTDTAETLADGLACRSPDPIATEVILDGAADILTVSDDDILAAMRHYFTDTHNVAEGAGAAPLAALLAHRDRFAGQKVGLVLSGGNVDAALYRRALAEGEERS